MADSKDLNDQKTSGQKKVRLLAGNAKQSRETAVPGMQLIELLLLVGAGLVIGAIVGVFEAGFAWGLRWMDDIFALQPALFLPLLVPIALLLRYMFTRYGKKTKEGMGLIFKINQGKEERVPKRLLVQMTLATWLSHLGGASTGKEGVGMQIGAEISHLISRWIPHFQKKKTVFLITGMAAGFAGLFQTPYTAVFFALEVLVAGAIEYRALAPSISASFSAAAVASLLGVNKEAFTIAYGVPFSFQSHFWALLAIGILFGLVGALFAWSMHDAHAFFGTCFEKHAYLRTALFAALLALLLYLCGQGRYTGSGMNLIFEAFDSGTITMWDAPAKFVLSVFALSMGFVGGEVTPLFAIGTCAGFVLGPLLGLPAQLGAALGYAAVFGAGTNTWLAPMMVGMEIFGFTYFPYFFVVCSMAYLVNGNLSIYQLQRNLKAAYSLDDCHPKNGEDPLEISEN